MWAQESCTFCNRSTAGQSTGNQRVPLLSNNRAVHSKMGLIEPETIHQGSIGTSWELACCMKGWPLPCPSQQSDHTKNDLIQHFPMHDVPRLLPTHTKFLRFSLALMRSCSNPSKFHWSLSRTEMAKALYLPTRRAHLLYNCQAHSLSRFSNGEFSSAHCLFQDMAIVIVHLITEDVRPQLAADLCHKSQAW